MPKYRATVHVTGMSGESPRAVRSALDEQLRKSGLGNCRIVSVDLEAPPPSVSVRAPTAPTAPVADPTWGRRPNAGGLLLVAAAAWAIWFFWWMLTASPE